MLPQKFNQASVKNRTIPTFALDDTLPKFPLPTLEESLNKYRMLALPFTNSQAEVNRLNAQIEEALKNEHLIKAQKLLEEKYKVAKNYIHDDFWENYGYLIDRSPITPQESSEFVYSSNVGTVSQTLRAAIMLRGSGLAHLQLYNEQVPIIGEDENTPWTMHQFRSVFASCRRPGVKMDTIVRNFKTKKENAPQVLPKRTAIIGCLGFLYEIDLQNYLGNKAKENYMEGDEEILPVGAIELILKQIKQDAANRAYSERAAYTTKHHKKTYLKNIGVFTASNRTDWALARESLLNSDAINQDIVNRIENALVFLTLDMSAPESQEQVLHELSIPFNVGSRFHDKGTQLIVFENGRAGFSMEHAMMDAASGMQVHTGMEIYNRHWMKRAGSCPEQLSREESVGHSPNQFTFLNWGKVDWGFILPLQQQLFEHYYNHRYENSWNLKLARFGGIGRKAIKQLKVSPDSFLQLAFMLAYYDLRGSIPSTYESVGVLKFRHGRTEAGRSMSNEVKQIILGHGRALDGKQVRSACLAHSQHIADCAKGKSVNRHFFALSCVIQENNLTMPAFLLDEVYQNASKWDLSTSNAFYDLVHEVRGATSFRPMEGRSIGIVYSIQQNHVDLTLLAADKQFDPNLFLEKFSTSCGRLFQCLQQQQEESNNKSSKL